MECSEDFSEDSFFSSFKSSTTVQVSVKKRQKAEVGAVKLQSTSPLKQLLINPPFNYDEDIVDEICEDLLDGMELHLNAGKGDVFKDIDVINDLGRDLSSLKENAILYCVLDPHAPNIEESDLKLKIGEVLPLSLFSTTDQNESWPGEGGFALSKTVNVASYLDLGIAVAYFLEKVSIPRNEWAGMVANVVVVGNKGDKGLDLSDCPAGVLDIPLVLDLVDGFKKRTTNTRRGPYAARVVLSHLDGGKGQDLDFGFKQYKENVVDDDYRVYRQSNSILLHPETASYCNPDAKDCVKNK